MLQMAKTKQILRPEASEIYGFSSNSPAVKTNQKRQALTPRRGVKQGKRHGSRLSIMEIFGLLEHQEAAAPTPPTKKAAPTSVSTTITATTNNTATPRKEQSDCGDGEKTDEDRKRTKADDDASETKAQTKRVKTADRRRSTEKKGVLSYEKLRDLKQKVDLAIKEHKTFSVYGQFPSIRHALKQRGWVEKIVSQPHNRKIPSNSNSFSSPYSIITDDSVIMQAIQESLMRRQGIKSFESEAMLMTRMLRNTTVDFVWSVRYDPSEWQDANRKQTVNRLSRPSFTSKVGLCSFMQQMQWFSEDGVSETLFPRCYNICQPEEKVAFKNDFRVTACVNMLKWLVSAYENGRETSIESPVGKVPQTAIQFALKRCGEHVSCKSHEDIDRDEQTHIWDHQWDQFLTWYYMIIDDNAKLIPDDNSPIKDVYIASKSSLAKLRKYWPQIDLDGMRNIWILKPGNKCRGRGIQLMNRLEHVLHKINPSVMKESRYVVQKYIECPLLIYNTKFDIRQWFLVTSTHPLTIWMYRESYLRFCSQPFSLQDFHESVHLSNNAVQSKYKNGPRDSALPDENMWDCYTFQTYLRAIGHAGRWEDCIYPGMRASIIGTLLASQDHMDKRRNSFELFGADFMLTEDFSPWLIEINSCPCMSPTTSVTARMCGQCLEDVIKVVIDRRQDKKADTGMFECVYKQRIPPAPPYLGMTLAVRGTKYNFKNIKNSRLRKQETECTPPPPPPPPLDTEQQEKQEKKNEETESKTAETKAVEDNSEEKHCPVITDLIQNCTENVVQQNVSSEISTDLSYSTVVSNMLNTSNSATNNLGNENKMVSEEKKSNINTEKLKESETCKVSIDEHPNVNVKDADTTATKDETTPKKKKIKYGGWKNSNDAIKSMEYFNDWKLKLDETKNSCETMLANLRMTGDVDGIAKAKILCVDKRTNRTNDVTTGVVHEILNQLSCTATVEEDCKRRNDLPIVEITENLTKKMKDDSKVRSCYLNMFNNDGISKLKTKTHDVFNSQYLAQKLPTAQQIYSNAEKSGVSPMKAILPTIKQKHKFVSPNLKRKEQRIDNFFAVGMSLKHLREQQEHLVMPLGIEPRNTYATTVIGK